MQISTKTGVVHAMLSSFDAPKTLGQGARNSNTVARRIVANTAKLPELLVSPRRAICSSARLLQLLRPFGMHYGSCMSSQGVLWLLLLLVPHSTWQHLQSLEDKERSPSRQTSRSEERR